MSDLLTVKNDANILDDPRLDILKDSDGNLPLTSRQATAVLDRGKLLISAAAGSGKTSTLVKRILLNVVEGVAKLGDMLVCVYNDSAQAELRQRLHAGLINAAICEKDQTRRSRLLAAIDDLPFCRISTIHSFCSSLIRENFEKLGLSPVFEIADDTKMSALMDQAMDEVFDSCAEAGDSGFAELVEIFAVKRDEEGLKKYISDLYKRMVLFSDRQQFKKRVLSDFDSSPLHGELAELYHNRFKEALGVLERVYGDVVNIDVLCTKKFVDVSLRQAIELVEKALTASSFFELCKTVATAPPIDKHKPATGLSDDEKQVFYQAKSCIENIKGAVNTLSEFYVNWDDLRRCHVQNLRYTAKLIELTELTEEVLERLKSEQNVLGYQDLLILASRLLNEHPDLGAEYKMIFVDEYQDVDPLQESIFSRLIKDECFMVGDVKQSIYGFRLADSTILLSRKAAFEAGEGKVIEFNANFRSNREILSFVNEVFDSVMTQESADVDYRHEGAFDLSAARSVKPNVKTRSATSPSDDKEEEREYPSPVEHSDPCVKLCLFRNISSDKQSKNEEGIYDITAHQDDDEEEISNEDRQAYYILDQINSIVGKRLNDDYSDGRTLDYGDIAILSRNTLRKSPVLQRVLKVLREAGVPLDETNVGSEASEAERELVLMLKALDNPRQDIPFAGYLLSYFGGYDEQELADIAAYRGDCLYDKFLFAAKNGDALSEKIRKTLAELDVYRLKAGFKNVGELMRGITSDHMYDAYMLSKGEGSLAELKNFMDSVTEVSLGRFLEEYTQSDEKAVGAGANCVRVSTIHKFKGLESPVVFVLDISHTVREPSEELILSGDGYVGMKYYDLSTRTSRDTFSRLALKKLGKAKQMKEEMRLLYVALTRAKQLMYITMSIPKEYDFGIDPHLMGEGLSNPREFLSIAQFKRTLRHEAEEITLIVDPQISKRGPVMNSTPDPALTERVLEARAMQYPYSEATSLAMKYSVSQISGSDDVSQSLFDEDGEQAAKKGTAYHRVMQNIDLSASTAEDVNIQLCEMVQNGVLTEEEKALVDAEEIARCLASEVMQEAREASARGECEREKSFIMLKAADELGIGNSRDRVLVQGVIDLLIKSEKRIIVDFKTGYVTKDRVPERYKKQLYLYKTAAEAADNVKVDKILLYSFKSGETVEI